LGVGAIKPKLSWDLQSTQQNILQTAYRIIVADDSLLLQKNMAIPGIQKKYYPAFLYKCSTMENYLNQQKK